MNASANNTSAKRALSTVPPCQGHRVVLYGVRICGMRATANLVVGVLQKPTAVPQAQRPAEKALPKPHVAVRNSLAPHPIQPPGRHRSTYDSPAPRRNNRNRAPTTYYVGLASTTPIRSRFTYPLLVALLSSAALSSPFPSLSSPQSTASQPACPFPSSHANGPTRPAATNSNSPNPVLATTRTSSADPRSPHARKEVKRTLRFAPHCSGQSGRASALRALRIRKPISNTSS
ncbi:uncharacterized protein K452DRAFT_314006 [Aplosporella prunicola CBS 121167]|uniref:Uncharacterized protein n=1 Tax=Aplosporella prunicola CBS 121167 TaxID=1176127 RepID=A0A6A6AXB5_9PEZI|nr:uncharacterized protein K452DRAFT_314006 [Aplosporella prunicola CBS 121167]KAF2135427.1 hypothetical protein K452DRAFT_314006 [Aplosporella prunicola CBS 121167]